MNNYEITIQSSEGYTKFEIELTNDEYNTISKIEDLSHAFSQYESSPVLSINLKK